MIVTDEMVERAWAAIVGRDIAPQCFNASIIRADLRTALESVGAPAQGAPDREATSEFVRRLRRYNAAHLAYDLSHDEAIDALLALTSTNDQLIANKGDSAS